MSASPRTQPLDSARPASAARKRPSASYFSSLGALYVLTLRQHLHGKRWLVLGALFLLPAVLAGVVRATAEEAPPRMLEFLFVFMFITQALLPLVALLYGSGIVQDEQEEQTFTYLLVRPISKWAIYAVKVLATVTTAVFLTAVFTALTYAAIYVGTDADVADVLSRSAKAVGVHALVVVAYCCLFGVMSLFTKRTLILGFVYAAFFEGLLANLPFSVRLLALIYYGRLMAYRLMSFVVAMPYGQKVDVAAEAWQLDVRTDPSLLEHPSLRACVLVLVGVSIVCTALGAYLCSRREFHVKTPEGG
jgi:ABC-type transport system involved in multi-copper enzyme maturation permease subunit